MRVHSPRYLQAKNASSAPVSGSLVHRYRAAGGDARAASRGSITVNAACHNASLRPASVTVGQHASDMQI
eukprot:3672119-Rhodomonas_salina.1